MTDALRDAVQRALKEASQLKSGRLPQVSPRLSPDDSQALDRLAARMGLTRSRCAEILLAAAIQDALEIAQEESP